MIDVKVQIYRKNQRRLTGKNLIIYVRGKMKIFYSTWNEGLWKAARGL